MYVDIALVYVYVDIHTYIHTYIDILMHTRAP